MDQLSIIAGASLTAAGVIVGAILLHRRSRLSQLEHRQDRIDAVNALLWRHNRELIDHIYQGKPPPPPDYPERLLNLLTETGRLSHND